MNPWRLVDAIATWLGSRLTAHAQLRLGILMVLASIPLAIYGPFSGEPLVIYEMSALALTIAGVGVVVTAEVLLNQEKDRGG